MSETLNTVKTPMKNKFSLDPKTDEEINYLEKLEELLESKRRGDWRVVGEMVKIPATSAEKAFFRVYQKNHFEVVSALEKIVNNRKELIK